MVLEIESVDDYYDGPLTGKARLGERRLYYVCVDVRIVEGARPMKDRIYAAWDLSDAEWALLDRCAELERDAVTPDGGDADPESVARADAAASAVGDLHQTLSARPWVVGFLESWLRFPAFVD